MKCARLHLHERCKPRESSGTHAERPRRFCQRRMVDPAHEEDPRWADLLERFHCNSNDDTIVTSDRYQNHQHEDLFLSVQNLKFNGDTPERKRPKTCFKYKALNDGKKHRMFVKQVVEEEDDHTENCSSRLTCYYFDDYVKYIVNEQSAPTSEKSSILFDSLNSKGKEIKASQVDARKKGSKEGNDPKKCRKPENDNSKSRSKESNEAVKQEAPELTPENTTVSYHKSGERQCLTIARARSPETVQVIRVDVVCAHGRCSTGSDSEENKKQSDTETQHAGINMKSSHFSDKYLLTNTTKTLDENVSGGAKVTLLCKTFRLSRRKIPTIKKSQTKNKYIK